ncbi:hypothetical protein C8J56DRAFT_1022667 [Mycena floridula]|nr:hypothetical protein C8J56DRAFT_1022667 [Mycena floridula]
MPVLTRHAVLTQKSILIVLPDELTTEIILCDCSTLAAFLAHGALYQIARFDLPQKVISLDAALSANPQYGAWVRNLDKIDRDFSSLTDILRSTKELRQLSVDWPEVCYSGSLSFAHLRILNISGYTIGIHHPSHHLTLVAAFLYRHPAVSHLAISFSSPAQSWTQKLDLPNLIALQGHLDVLGNAPTYALYVVESSHSTIWTFSLASRNVRTSAFSSRTRELATNIRFRTSLKRLPLPHLKSCMFVDYSCTYSSSALKSTLADELSGFKQLESFCLVTMKCDSHVHSSIVQSWLKSCPSLQEGVLLDVLPYLALEPLQELASLGMPWKRLSKACIDPYNDLQALRKKPRLEEECKALASDLPRL